MVLLSTDVTSGVSLTIRALRNEKTIVFIVLCGAVRNTYTPASGQYWQGGLPSPITHITEEQVATGTFL
jgi:hypothetical protein